MKPEIDPSLNNTSNDLTVEQKRKRLQLLQLQARARAAQRPPADMSFMGRLKDNVVGVDDGVMSTGEKLATALNMRGESSFCAPFTSGVSTRCNRNGSLRSVTLKPRSMSAQTVFAMSYLPGLPKHMMR